MGDEAKKEAKAEQAKVERKTVKVRVLKPFLNKRTRMIEAQVGKVVEVFEEDVPKLTKENFGQFDFQGERVQRGSITRVSLRKAELVSA